VGYRTVNSTLAATTPLLHSPASIDPPDKSLPRAEGPMSRLKKTRNSLIHSPLECQASRLVRAPCLQIQVGSDPLR
jgi:hypothetical protein